MSDKKTKKRKSHTFRIASADWQIWICLAEAFARDSDGGQGTHVHGFEPPVADGLEAELHRLLIP
jgi:hypothetical protein